MSGHGSWVRGEFPGGGPLCTRRKWIVWSALLLAGCTLLYPPRYERVSLLVPRSGPQPGYTLAEDGTIAYAVEGLRVEVRYMTDRALNARWPRESSAGPHSYNAYTYGDYVDPQAGYVRNRFTVFAVSVYNLDFPKVELQPLQSRLTTNRRGEELTPYGLATGSAARSFESYYRARKGVTGNEDYRFDMRMGQVRTSNYGVGEKIYKGENYSGFIVFDPLADEVEEVRLHIRDFILKFNAFDQPLLTFDMDFCFVRQIEQAALVNQTRAAALTTQVRLQAPSEVNGYAPGDLARTPATIDALVRSQLDAFNRCFAGEFQAGRALLGSATIRFVILASGLVASAQLLASTVDSDLVGDCLVEQVKRWRLRPSARAVADSVAGAQAPLRGRDEVVATCFVEFAEAKPD